MLGGVLCRSLLLPPSLRARAHAQVALSLRLVMAKALRRMGKLDEAETHFKVRGGGWGTFLGAACCRASAAVLALPSPASPAEPLASHHAPLLQVLAGWVTEGEAAFGEMSGSAPVSIHQQALRGIALVALERGDKGAAMAQVRVGGCRG